MALTRSFRRWHRRLGIVVGIQLVLWTVSGIYFAWTDLDEIHGDHHRSVAPRIAFDSTWVAPTAIDFAGAGRTVPDSLASLSIVAIDGRTYYRTEDGAGEVLLADVSTGRVRGPLTPDEALSLARASFAPDARVARITRLEREDVGPHHEYRGGALPAWVVEFDHASSTRVYVAAHEGEVAKHRNAQWRAFDFLWMLHTMDYRGRDDFNNPVLRIVALMAMAAVVSGVLLWARTVRWGRR